MSARHEWASGARRVDTPADLARTITEADQVGAIGTAILFRALAAGRIACLPVYADTGGGKLKQFFALTRGRPTVVLAGDDDYQNRGPAGWPQADRIARWCNAVLIHATGALPEHYEWAILAAEIAKRVVVIECSTATAPAWIDVFKRAPNRPRMLFLRPSEGAHPVPPSRLEVH